MSMQYKYSDEIALTNWQSEIISAFTNKAVNWTNNVLVRCPQSTCAHATAVSTHLVSDVTIPCPFQVLGWHFQRQSINEKGKSIISIRWWFRIRHLQKSASICCIMQMQKLFASYWCKIMLKHMKSWEVVKGRLFLQNPTIHWKSSS